MGIYRFLTEATAPGIALYLFWRRLRGKEDSVRFSERLGKASVLRPQGPLAWCHAASVGEAISALGLLREIRKIFPEWTILLTSGTVTSAHVLSGRLPKGVIHQYAPVDRWPYINRFLDHWRPAIALRIESELWPNTLAALRQRMIPAVLINARLSERSFRRWSFLKGSSRNLLGTFSLILAQTGEDGARFRNLGAPNVLSIGNLKYAADPLPCNALELDRLRMQTGPRPVWLMASTHPGEDVIALSAHAKLKERWPSLLTIIVPRHPRRGNAIMKLIIKRGLRGARRTMEKNILPSTEIYLADTMGELGLFYRLAPVTCLGGSFVWGGHNPIEPAQLGCALLFGPRMTNFEEIATDLLARRAAIQIHSPNELALRLDHILSAPHDLLAQATAARALAEEKRGVLNETMSLLAPLLSPAAEASRESA